MASEIWIPIAVALVVWGILRLTGWPPSWVPRRSLPKWYGFVDIALGLALAVLGWLIAEGQIDAEHASTIVLIVGGAAVGSVFLGHLIRAFKGIRKLRARSLKRESEDERLKAYLRKH